MMTLSFFKWNGKSPSSPVMGFFLCADGKADFANKFPYGIVNQSIIATITRLETFS